MCLSLHVAQDGAGRPRCPSEAAWTPPRSTRWRTGGRAGRPDASWTRRARRGPLRARHSQGVGWGWRRSQRDCRHKGTAPSRGVARGSDAAPGAMPSRFAITRGLCFCVPCVSWRSVGCRVTRVRAGCLARARESLLLRHSCVSVCETRFSECGNRKSRDYVWEMISLFVLHILHARAAVKCAKSTPIEFAVELMPTKSIPIRASKLSCYRLIFRTVFSTQRPPPTSLAFCVTRIVHDDESTVYKS